MDYSGLYHDLSEMHRTGLDAAFKADLSGNQLLTWVIEEFIEEVAGFMDDIVTRKW